MDRGGSGGSRAADGRRVDGGGSHSVQTASGLREVTASARVTRMMVIMSEYGISKTVAGRRSRRCSPDRAVQRDAAAAIRTKSTASAVRMVRTLVAAAHAAKTAKKVEPSSASCPDAIGDPHGGHSSVGVSRDAAPLPATSSGVLRVRQVDGVSRGASGRQRVEAALHDAQAEPPSPMAASSCRIGSLGSDARGGERSPQGPTLGKRATAYLIATETNRGGGEGRSMIKANLGGGGGIRPVPTAVRLGESSGPSATVMPITRDAMPRRSVKGSTGISWPIGPNKSTSRIVSWSR